MHLDSQLETRRPKRSCMDVLTRTLVTLFLACRSCFLRFSAPGGSS